MGRYTVLLVGAQESEAQADDLFHMGFEPLVRTSIEDAVKALRRERFAAVLLDRRHASLDPVELVLNVRDLDASVPVVVTDVSAQADETRRVLRDLPGTHVVESSPRHGRLRGVLDELVRVPEGPDASAL